MVKKYDWDMLECDIEMMIDLIIDSEWCNVFFFLSNSIVEVIGVKDWLLCLW